MSVRRSALRRVSKGVQPYPRLPEEADPTRSESLLADAVLENISEIQRLRVKLQELEDPESGDRKLLRDLWERVAELEGPTDFKRNIIERIRELESRVQVLEDLELEIGGTS